MKKIDLHIHTVSTISDRAFEFSMDAIKRYVSNAKLDAIAVTNHDVFDLEQFKQIENALEIAVFPGIEINVENGHLLVIGPRIHKLSATRALGMRRASWDTGVFSAPARKERTP